MPGKRIISSTFLVLAVIAAASFSSSASTAMSSEEAAKWREDLAYLSREILANHPYLPKVDSDKEKIAACKITKEEFESRVRDIDRDIPVMSEPGVIVAMMKLLASIGDVHTAIWGPYHPTLPHIPVYLTYFKDGTYVTKAAEEYESYIGWKLERIGNAEIADVYEKMSELIPRENDVRMTRVLPSSYFNVPAYLYELGITSDPGEAVFRFRTPAGQERDVTLRPVDIKNLRATVAGWRSVFDAAESPLPIFERNRSKPYWTEYLPEKKTVYFAYNECRDDTDNPLSSIFADIRKMLHSDDGAERLIIDLRWNGGGNSTLLDPFIDELSQDPKTSRKGSLFCLIGSSTFSSGMLNAMRLRSRSHAVLVGSPTGGAPNQYRNSVTLTLPNSRLLAICSTGYHASLPRDYPSSIMPDVRTDMTWSSYKSGIDPALEAIWSYEP